VLGGGVEGDAVAEHFKFSDVAALLGVGVDTACKDIAPFDVAASASGSGSGSGSARRCHTMIRIDRPSSASATAASPAGVASRRHRRGGPPNSGSGPATFGSPAVAQAEHEHLPIGDLSQPRRVSTSVFGLSARQAVNWSRSLVVN
jgi:hypothetical protein